MQLIWHIGDMRDLAVAIIQHSLSHLSEMLIVRVYDNTTRSVWC